MRKGVVRKCLLVLLNGFFGKYARRKVNWVQSC